MHLDFLLSYFLIRIIYEIIFFFVTAIYSRNIFEFNITSETLVVGLHIITLGARWVPVVKNLQRFTPKI